MRVILGYEVGMPKGWWLLVLAGLPLLMLLVSVITRRIRKKARSQHVVQPPMILVPVIMQETDESGEPAVPESILALVWYSDRNRWQVGLASQPNEKFPVSYVGCGIWLEVEPDQRKMEEYIWRRGWTLLFWTEDDYAIVDSRKTTAEVVSA